MTLIRVTTWNTEQR